MKTKWSYFFTILIPGLLANGQPNVTHCDSPWNITIDGDHLRWTGEDRDADVIIHLEPDTFNGTGVACSNITLNVPFSTREALIESQCSNNLHLANATIVCDDSSSNEMEILHLQEEVTGAPFNIFVTKVTNISITLEWSEPTSSAPIDGYSVRKSISKTSFPSEVLHTIETKYELGGLQPYTSYYIQVRATYETVNGPWSESITERTKTSVPFTPAGVVKQSSTNSSILVKWKEPTPFVGPILKYTIKWVRINSTLEETRDLNQTYYEIDDLSAYTNYSVQVRSSTEAGTGHWSRAVIVSTDIGVPTVPRDISVTNTSSTSISLSWEAPEPANGPILNYAVAWGARGSAVFQVLVSETQYETKSLKPYIEYVFEVAATTKAGLGPYSERLFVWTDIDLPSQPKNVTSLEVANTSISIEWIAPEQPNGPLLPYVVKVFEYNSNKTMEVASDFPNCTVDGLFPYANYSVQVCAQTEAGRGEWAEEFDFRTEIGIPSAPKHLSTPEVLPTRIHLEWSIPDSPAGPSLDYLVQWGVKGTTASLLVTSETTYQAIGLRPYTEYFFNVAARTEAGVGLSEILIVYTDIAAPSVPGDITGFGTTESSIYLSWTPPQHPNGPHILYLVQWAELSENLTFVDDNTTSTEYSIENLKSSTNYSVRIAARTSVGQGPWTDLVYITTSEKGPVINLPLILGLVLGLALPLLILLIVGVIILKRKGGLKFVSSISSPKTAKKEPSPYQYDNPPAQLGVYHLTPKSLTVQNFEERINSPMYKSRIEMVKEFGDLKKNSPQHSSAVAKLEENLPKNRWGKMLPYDHSRVKLFPYGDKLKPDFINANYVQGDSYLLEYIASQGPLKETLDDFWTMIWQQSVSVVVMLTQCVEKAVRNCEQYWPTSGQSKICGEIQVYTQSEIVLTSYVERVLVVQFHSQKRHVIHMQFSNWPVSGCPRTPDEFLYFVRKVRGLTSDRRPGPILVHCSAGVGRTGTFIAVDRLFQHLEHSDDIDIFGTVLDMRRYRPHMVHTDDQYTFIYACVKRFLEERKEAQESLYEVAL